MKAYKGFDMSETERGWDGKMYDKYRIEHTDGTPLKGKKYYVLRLDSDDPVEAARVSAAMRAYKSEPRNCDVGTLKVQDARWKLFCDSHECSTCPVRLAATKSRCCLVWGQMPYEEGGAK